MNAIKKRELRAEIQELNMQKHYIQALNLSPGFVAATIGVDVHPLNSLNQNNSHGTKIGVHIKLQKRTYGETEFIHNPVSK